MRPIRFCFYGEALCFFLLNLQFVVLAKKNQANEIFRLVRDIDENAFISQSNVVGVYGEGFDKLKVKKKKA